AYPVRRTARQPVSRCPTDALGSGKAKATWYGWHRALKSGVLRAQKSPSTLCLQRTRAGAPYQIRTGDPLFTRQMLWPAELRRRGPTDRGRIDPGESSPNQQETQTKRLARISLTFELRIGEFLEGFPSAGVFVVFATAPY